MNAPGGGFTRLLQVLLAGGGVLAVMFEGYFDESGSFEDEPKIFCLSGYFLESASAVEMDKEWGRVLAEHNIPYFHMVDCAHGVGVFAGRSKEERSEIVRKLIDLIKKHTLQGFSAFANANYFLESTKDGDVYTQCASLGVSALQLFLEAGKIKGDVAYFFESGHKSKGRAYNHVANKLGAMSAPITFGSKEQIRLLQAADLLAWQSTKYAKDAHLKIRAPRKDFMSLMEHSHDFYFSSIQGGEKMMAVESWPLSRRSRDSYSLTFHDKGRIPFMLQSGDDAPIVMVRNAIGWRPGAGGLAYIAFDSMDETRFYLALDKIRLFDSVVAHLAAMEVFTEGDPLSVIQAKGITAHPDSAGVILKIEIDGVSVAFRVSTEVFERLLIRH